MCLLLVSPSIKHRREMDQSPSVRQRLQPSLQPVSSTSRLLERASSDSIPDDDTADAYTVDGDPHTRLAMTSRRVAPNISRKRVPLNLSRSDASPSHYSKMQSIFENANSVLKEPSPPSTSVSKPAKTLRKPFSISQGLKPGLVPFGDSQPLHERNKQKTGTPTEASLSETTLNSLSLNGSATKLDSQQGKLQRLHCGQIS